MDNSGGHVGGRVQGRIAFFIAVTEPCPAYLTSRHDRPADLVQANGEELFIHCDFSVGAVARSSVQDSDRRLSLQLQGSGSV